jgi:hypothetical protein
MIRRRQFIILLGGAAVARPVAASAQSSLLRDQRAERLADAVGHDLRVVHGREHRPSRVTPAAAAIGPPLPSVISRTIQPNAGHVHVHQGGRAATMPMPPNGVC